MPGAYHQAFGGMPMQMPGTQQVPGMSPLHFQHPTYPSPHNMHRNMYPSPSPTQSPMMSPRVMPSPRAVHRQSEVWGARPTSAAGGESPSLVSSPRQMTGKMPAQVREAAPGRGNQGNAVQVQQTSPPQMQVKQAAQGRRNQGSVNQAQLPSPPQMQSGQAAPSRGNQRSAVQPRYCAEDSSPQSLRSSSESLVVLPEGKTVLPSYASTLGTTGRYPGDQTQEPPPQERTAEIDAQSQEKLEQNMRGGAQNSGHLQSILGDAKVRNVSPKQSPLGGRQFHHEQRSHTLETYVLQQEQQHSYSTAPSPRISEILQIPFVPFSFILVRHLLFAVLFFRAHSPCSRNSLAKEAKARRLSQKFAKPCLLLTYRWSAWACCSRKSGLSNTPICPTKRYLSPMCLLGSNARKKCGVCMPSPLALARQIQAKFMQRTS